MIFGYWCIQYQTTDVTVWMSIVNIIRTEIIISVKGIKTLPKPAVYARRLCERQRAS